MIPGERTADEEGEGGSTETIEAMAARLTQSSTVQCKYPERLAEYAAVDAAAAAREAAEAGGTAPVGEDDAELQQLQAGLATRGLLLFDVGGADPCEQEDQAAAHPEIVAQLLARLDDYAATAVRADEYEREGAEACRLGRSDGDGDGDSSRSSDPQLFAGAWTPWCPL
jgi:hypothetical protein